MENYKTFTSFDQCNEILKCMDEIDLKEYLELSRKVPYDHDLIKSYPQIHSQSQWMDVIIEFMVSVSFQDPRDFQISVLSLEEIGLHCTSYPSRIPQWMQTVFNCHDNMLKKNAY